MRMGMIGSTILVLSIANTAAAGQATPPKVVDVKKAAPALSEALMTKEKAIIAAVLAHDKAAFAKALTTDALMVDESGYVSVSDFLQAFESMKAESATPSDMKVIVLNPSTALVTYKLDQKGSFNGQDWPSPVYATTMWVNKGGTWHAAFHQESTAKH